MAAPLVSIHNLTVAVERRDDHLALVRDVSFEIPRGAIVGLVGESGSGKSLLASAICGVFPSEDLGIRSGGIEFDGQELTTLDKKSYRALRGRQITMILQDSLAALNPVMTIRSQLREMYAPHDGGTGTAGDGIVAALRSVSFPKPEVRMHAYPHQLSGGMRQRAAAGMALLNRPQLVIADEPTTALDVTVQAQFLRLLASLNAEFGVSILFISHDLSVVGQLASKIVVMYGGRVMEEGPPSALFRKPGHPYTEALINAIPTLGTRGGRLSQIPGFAPAADQLPQGCPFSTRCGYATPQCETMPPLEHYPVRESRIACWHPLDEKAEVVP